MAAAAGAGSDAAAGSRKVQFADLSSRAIAKMVIYLGTTAMDADVRAFACVNKLTAKVVRRLPHMAVRVDGDDAPATHPDGSLRSTAEEGLARIARGDGSPVSLTLFGAVTESFLLEALRLCPRLLHLSLSSTTVVNWAKVPAPAAGEAPLAPNLQRLEIARCPQLYGLSALLEHMPALRSLDVLGCPDIDANELEPLAARVSELQGLSFNICAGIDDLAARVIAAAPPAALRDLSFASCPRISRAGVMAVVSAAPLLRSLDLAMCSMLDDGVCADLAAAKAVLPKLSSLRLPPRASDAGLAAIIGDHGGKARTVASAAAASGLGAGPESPVAGLSHLGLAMTGVSDATLGALLEAAPFLQELDLQGCNALSFRVVDELVKHGRNLQRVDVRGNRRLRWDDAAKLVSGLPNLVLLVCDEALATERKLIAAAGPESVRLRAKPGLTVS
ncbi:hypothetical protein FNF29_00623 [Cafeteria roenbergensis]|uniref:F-box domain-containing protein n=1 Tax=Cafeteria roenbergensis TaxID=33653 RepID=A0A5A8CZP0_CAFRO|nr:hypothetical protein FNF29_00623 [Cafeteria roenbergensis]|eukprot:KAA0157271.1 hypothetical protein FNF29_00623 [Cafeteria roenbergensis]